MKIVLVSPLPCWIVCINGCVYPLLSHRFSILLSLTLQTERLGRQHTKTLGRKLQRKALTVWFREFRLMRLSHELRRRVNSGELDHNQEHPCH